MNNPAHFSVKMENRKGFFAYLAIASCLGIEVSRSGIHLGPLSLLIVYLFWTYLKDNKPRMLFLLCLLTSAGFYTYMTIVQSHNSSVHSDSETHIIGKVNTPVLIDGDKATFEIMSERKEIVLVEYYLNAKEETTKLKSFQLGEHCEWEGVLKPPLPASNPHAFDYKNYLNEQKKHWIFSLNSIPHTCNVTNNTSILKGLQKFRNMGTEAILHHIDPAVSSFMVSLIFGDRRHLDSKILDAYQQLGLIHLLAISGLHVGIITGAAFYIGIRVGLARQTVYIMLVILLPLYVILAGGAPSVMRAAMMTGVVLILLLMNKRAFSIDTIGVACIFVLLIDPYYLYHIGFQLSFTISLSLLLSSKKISSMKNGFLQITYVSFIAQFASLPLLLFHFYQFSMWSPFLNILFVPFFSLFVLPAAFILFFVMLIYPQMLPFIVPVFALPLEFMNNLAVWFASLSFGTLVFGKPSIIGMSLIVISTVLLFYGWEKGRMLPGLAIYLSCLCLLWNIQYLNPSGKVVVIDIGQGDAILIRLPWNKGTYLIDTGGTVPFPKEDWKVRKKEYNSGTAVLLPYLKAEGIRKLDKLILSHGDYDHIGNVGSLWNHMKVKEVIVPAGFGGSSLEEAILQEADIQGAVIQTAIPKTGWKVGDASFLYLHPELAYENKNEGSVALYAYMGKRSWLFTGDMEEEGEREVLLRFPKLEVDILKAGHHGSRTSTGQAFIDKLKPEIAIISAGRNNRFGHPHQEVLDRLEHSGAKVYRTDIQGAIIYRFTHRGGTFYTILP